MKVLIRDLETTQVIKIVAWNDGVSGLDRIGSERTEKSQRIRSNKKLMIH